MFQFRPATGPSSHDDADVGTKKKIAHLMTGTFDGFKFRVLHEVSFRAAIFTRSRFMPNNSSTEIVRSFISSLSTMAWANTGQVAPVASVTTKVRVCRPSGSRTVTVAIC
jgi:hypothetical protein